MREENMVAAQDIIQIFCEFIVARLPMIQSQRFAKEQRNIHTTCTRIDKNQHSNIKACV